MKQVQQLGFVYQTRISGLSQKGQAGKYPQLRKGQKTMTPYVYQLALLYRYESGQELRLGLKSFLKAA